MIVHEVNSLLLLLRFLFCCISWCELVRIVDLRLPILFFFFSFSVRAFYGPTSSASMFSLQWSTILWKCAVNSSFPTSFYPPASALIWRRRILVCWVSATQSRNCHVAKEHKSFLGRGLQINTSIFRKVKTNAINF